MVKQYRKKPVCIEAVQFFWSNIDEVKAFCTGRGAMESCATVRRVHDDHEALYITTLEGEHLASIGDFIIKGVHGEFYPCKPDIFEKTYEVVGDA